VWQLLTKNHSFIFHPSTCPLHTWNIPWHCLPLLPSRACERSGIGAERIENWVCGRARRPWIGSGARGGRVIERERSGERTKLVTQISLKGDDILLKLPKSILPDVNNKLSIGILIPISNRPRRWAYFVSETPIRKIGKTEHHFYLFLSVVSHVVTFRACRDVLYILLHTSPKTALCAATCKCYSILNY